MTLASIRANALSPALYAHAVPDGVLHDVGLAAWEMPAGCSAGQLHFLHSLDGDEYDAYLAEPYRSSLSVVNRVRLEDLKADLITSTYSRLDLQDMPGVYGRGTSLMLQNCTLSPYRIGGVDSYFEYPPVIGELLQAWPNRRMYVHLGMANADGFPFGELLFNNAYALECRAAENIYRIAVTPSYVGPSQFVQSTQLICADLQGRPWPHTFADITHPSVIALCMASIDGMVAALSTQVRYVLQGECNLAVFADIPSLSPLRASCFTAPMPTQCQHCEPTTNYSARMITGFRQYLESVLGLNIAALNARWSTAHVSYATVDPLDTPFCPGNPTGLKDWFAFHRYLLLELGHLQQHRAKLANTAAQCSTLRFGEGGAEQSWLSGDFGSVGDWIGHTIDEYLSIGDHHLEMTASANRLSGVPITFGITAPPFILSASPPGQDSVPPLLRSFRTYTRNEVRMLFRDVWHAGAAHIGYLKGPSAAFGYHPSSREAVLSSIDDIVAMHSSMLAMAGPYQRIALHVEDAGAILNAGLAIKSSRTVYHLGRITRDAQIPHAVFESPRILTRTLARWWLSRSLVVVPYHTQIDSLRDTYIALFPDGAPGGAIFVEQGDPLTAPGYCEPAALLTTTLGRLYRVKDGASVPVNCWALVTREPGSAQINSIVLSEPLDNDAFSSQAAIDIHQSAIPYVKAALGATYSDTPVTITASAGQVLSSFVSDGVNFTVAISNVGAGNATVGVSVLPAVATALGVTYQAQSITLTPRQTEYVHLAATPTGIDATALGEAHDSATANLAILTAAGYGTTEGTEILNRMTTLLAAGRLGRAAAAYAAVLRMVFLRVVHLLGDVTVNARRIGLESEASTLPVVGARVQVVWRLNAGEEGATAVTDGAGDVLMGIAAPAAQRWDFTATAPVSPPATADNIVEIHVTDAVWGSSTRAVVAT